MRLLCFISLIILLTITHGDDLQKYRSLREQCQRNPTNSECLSLKSKFLQLIAKCQNLLSPQQIIVCQEVKMKLCAVFPSTCTQATTKPPTSTKQGKTTKRKLLTTTTTTTTTTTEKAKPVITTPRKAKAITTTTTARKSEIIITTTQSELNPSETITNEEFVKVPINPDDLRVRGEYCVRHGKEKKCQQLLTNLKNTYSTCAKKKAEPQPERIDCHSFQTHLCKAFPKFPPCIKKTPT